MEFLNPWGFLFLFGFIIVFIKNTKLPFKKEIIEKITNKVTFGKKQRFFIYLLAYLFFVIALTRPVIDNGYTTVKLPKNNIVIILDSSKAMKCKDLYPNRFEAAKEKIEKLLPNLKLQNVSIILSDNVPYLLNPPSNDYNSIIYLLNHVDEENLFTSDTSNINQAIISAKKNIKNPLILVFSYKKPKEGIFYNISKQSCEIDGNFYPYDNNGIHFSYSNEDIQKIISLINKKNQSKTIKIKNYKELFYYFLLLGIILVFIASSRSLKWKKLYIFYS